MDKKLIKEVQNLVNETEKTHRYSMSKIYGLSNRVFDKNEQPQSCASCLIRKVRELKIWLEAEESKEVDLSPANLESVDLVEKSTKEGRRK